MRTLRAAIVLTAVGAFTGCVPDTPPTAPQPGAAPSAARDGGVPGRSNGTSHPHAIQRRLERAADGLLYTSESDYPFTFFFQAAAVRGPLTAEAFRAAVGVPADSVVEEATLDAFFARHIERADPGDAAAQALVPRFRRLEAAVRSSVHDARVFRVGRILIRCYIVGTDRGGNVVGLTTWVVET